MNVYRRHEKTFDGLLSVAGGLLLWELAARFAVRNALLLVPPSQVATAAVALARQGVLARHVAVTGFEFLVGFSAATAAGLVLGVALCANRLVRELAMPWVTIGFNVPIITLAPLLVIALGLGIASKIAIVFVGALFPVLFNTYAGILTTDERLTEMVRAFGGTRRDVFVKAVLPSALPLMMTGIRLGAGRALVAAIVSELFGARAGVGFLIYSASQEFETANAFVGVVILGIAGYLLFQALRAAEGRLAPWYAHKL
jgi:NitT/TauT family transport system permease protein